MKAFLGGLRHLRRHDFLAIALTCLSSGAVAVLTVWQFGDKTKSIHWLLAVVFWLSATLGVAMSAAYSNTVRSEAERKKRQLLAASLIEDACETATKLMSRCPEKAGGVVYLPDRHNPDRVNPTYIYNKEGKPEEKLSFSKREGCVGHVWATGRQTVADLSEATPEILEEHWKLSRNGILLTSNLQAIVCTPIMSSEQPPRMVGVVSIDSQVADSECGLLAKESLARARQHAEMVASILELAELV